MFPQSAPPPLCPSGRTPDLKALLNVVDNARSFIYIAVMNYLPTMEFSHPRRYCGARGQGSGLEATRVEEEAGEGVMGPRKQTGDRGRGHHRARQRRQGEWLWLLETRERGQRKGCEYWERGMEMGGWRLEAEDAGFLGVGSRECGRDMG